MTTIRVKKNKNYFAVSNIPFNDTRLSWEARGLIGYLLSKPDDWQIMFNDIVNQGPAGDYKVRSILKELQEFGYLIRERTKNSDGTFTWNSTVFENPTISRLPTDGLSIDGSPTDGLSIDGKPRDILSTESLSTNKQKTEQPSVSSSVSSFGDNLARDCMKLYTMVTGQINPPSSQVDKAITDLSTILDHYKSVDAAIPDGKRAFARWCSSSRKDGRPYSATNTDWLGWWLDDIAPRPEKAELSVIERVFGPGGIK